MIALAPDAYRLLLRPLLFRLPPEAAQRVADFALKQGLVWRSLAPAFRVSDERLHVDLNGLKLRSPVGLAAGYDKSCEFLSSMAALGFGYVVGGTVTELARPGNPSPRIVRYVKEQSLVNALGFPGKGLEFAARQLAGAADSFPETPFVVSVAGVTVDEMVRCHRRLEPLVAAVEINISSPNTAGLRVFQEPAALAELVRSLNEGRSKPLFVKLPPYASDGPAGSEDRDRVLGLVRACMEEGVDGLTLANSRPTEDPRLAVGRGGLSGKLIFEDMLRMVADVRSEVGQRVSLNACGGIFTGEDAWRALRAGATTVQLLTGLIYRGPGIVRRMNREILEIMDREGVESLAHL